MSRLGPNNFDLIRLVLAGMVALVHVSVLSAEPTLAWIPRVISSDLAVKAFFVISGFLIVMSYERSPGWISYAGKRWRRIYPAYATVILLSGVLLVLASTASARDYFSATWLRFLAVNLAFLNFLQPTLPGVFDANPLPVVNGALWTLKIEVAFYACVPPLVWLCRRFGSYLVLALTYTASVAYVATMTRLAASGAPIYETLAHQLPGQLSYFATGAALYYVWPAIGPRRVLIGLVALATLAIDQIRALPALEPAALGAAVVAAGTARSIGNASRFGDFSYGLYILHFPIIQLFAHAGWFAGQPWTLLVTALAASLAGAVVLWHAVEKRWLLDTSHYRAGVGALRP